MLLETESMGSVTSFCIDSVVQEQNKAGHRQTPVAFGTEMRSQKTKTSDHEFVTLMSKI